MIDTTKYTQLLILKRHWPLSVATALTVVALIVPVALGMPNVYRSTTKLTVQKQVSTTATQAQIFNGLEMRLLMIRNETLSTPYLTNMIDRLNLYPEMREKTNLETVVNRVQRDISINQTSTASGGGGQSTLTFTVSYIGDDPHKVKEVADALAQFYIDQNDDLRNQAASQMVQDSETQVKEAKKQYDEAYGRLTGYLANHAGKLPSQIALKQGELARISGDLGIKTTRFNTVKSLKETYQLQIAQAMNQTATATVPAVSQSRDQQLNAAHLEERNLLERNAGPENLQLINVRAKIKALEALPPDPPTTSGKPVATTPLDIYRKQLADADEQLEELRKAIDTLEESQRKVNSELMTIPTQSPELDDLNRNVQVTRDQYDAAQRNYNQAYSAMQIERSQENEEFRILEPASFPAEPAGPNRISLILFGFVAALVLGLGVAIARDQLDTSFHTIDELRGFTSVPILASIPHIVTNKQRARRAIALLAGAAMLLVSLAFVGYGAYQYATRHAGLTRLVTK